MKRISLYITNIIMALILFTSCEQESITVVFEKPNTLTLQLTTGGMNSRATENGESNLNENLLSTLDVFLYKTDGTYFKTFPFTPNAHGSTNVSIPLTDDELKTLFGITSSTITDGTYKCKAYVIANKTASVDITNTAVEDLKKNLLSSISDDNNTFADAVKEENFVMDSRGDDEVTMLVEDNGTTKSFTGNISLYRSAAKIRLFVNTTTITDNGKIWTPVSDEMQLTLHNGVSKGYIDNGYYTPEETELSTVYFDNPEIAWATSSTNENGTITTSLDEFDGPKINDVDATYYSTSLPYYSYPSNWNESGANKDHDAYFLLMIPWENKVETTNENGETEIKSVYRNSYYQIPINHNNKTLERNTYYKMYVNVGIFGGELGEEITLPKWSYVLVEAAEWEQEELSVQLHDNVYLVVDKNLVTINNENEVSVGYVSSHDISIKIDEIWHWNYKEIYPVKMYYKTEYSNNYTFTYDDPENKTNIISHFVGNSSTSNSGDITGSGNITVDGTTTTQRTHVLLRDFEVSCDDSKITLKHDLVNYDGTGEFDISPYNITVTVTMKYIDADGKGQTMTETITFIQKPAIILEAELNSDHANMSSTSTNKGYVIVNGYETTNNQGGNKGDGDNGETGVNGLIFPYGTYTTTTSYTGQSSSETVQYLAQVNGDFTPANSDMGNPFMFVLTVSAMNSNKFIIGDPRTTNHNDVFQVYTADYTTNGDGITTDSDDTNKTSWYWSDYMKFSTDNNNYNVWANSYCLYKESDDQNARRLKYYYGTDESSNSEYVIAPKIRFSSSHSIPGPIVFYKEQAKRRGAAYQEDGYPAGRWRLPTRAEVEFILFMTANDMAPELFNTGHAYWSAHGYFSDYNGGDDMEFVYEEDCGSNSGSVRLVYDDWYWTDGQLKDKTKFTWGDYPRSEFKNAVTSNE